MTTNANPAGTGVPAETRVVSLYRILSDDELANLWRLSDEEQVDNFRSQEIDSVGDQALLIWGAKEPKPPEWSGMIEGLTGVDVGFASSEPSSVLFVRVDAYTFALTFGGGWRLLRGGLIDREFGLNFALRAINSEEIRHLKKQYFNATSRVDINLVPGGQGLWSFGIREYSELVRQITGRAATANKIDLGHMRRLQRRGLSHRTSFDCTERIRLPLPYSPNHLVQDLKEIVRVLEQSEVDMDLEPLQWIRRINPAEVDLIAEAWSKLFELIEGYFDEVSLAYPARYHGGPEIGSFAGQIGGHSIKNKLELELSDIRIALEGHDFEARVRALKNGWITGYDDDGNSIGGDESAQNWLSGQVDLSSGRRLVLLDGDWFDLTDRYRDFVDRIVGDAFRNRPSWLLPAWKSSPKNDTGAHEEKLYNRYVADQIEGFLCLDRKLIRTRVHKRGFEACDLLGPNNELVHVKKISTQTGSGPLSHLFAQGIVSIESLTDRDTWERFISEIRKQDDERANSMGVRPTSLVYAIHRTNGVLTPDKMFTFAQSELASAAISFAKLGVDLKIAVIP